jgi:phosphatidylcholine synthase
LNPAQIRAFAVHILTASGTALAFAALILAVDARWPAMFLTLGVALLVDGIDGPLARRFDVVGVLPRWSGETLDLVVDFLTYVFVPAYAIAASGLLPTGYVIAAGIVICMSGALYFADSRMKTDDNHFRGFPAVWNLAAFYLFLLQPPAWLTVLSVIVLAVLTFLPVQFVHPLRVATRRLLNIALLAVWAVLAATALYFQFDPGEAVEGILVLIAVYFFVAGFIPTRD